MLDRHSIALLANLWSHRKALVLAQSYSPDIRKPNFLLKAEVQQSQEETFSHLWVAKFHVNSIFHYPFSDDCDTFDKNMEWPPI